MPADPGPPYLSTAQRRNRLARRHHLAAESRAPDVAAAARSLIGLHATDPASVHLSARTRVERIGVGDVDAALYEQRSIVKHMAMRRTLWAVAVDLLPLVQSAASDDIAAQQRRALVRDVERAGLARVGERWLAEAEAAVLATLAEHGPLLGRELSRRVPALRAKIGASPRADAPTFGVVTRVMTVLSASGLVTRARPAGPWYDRQTRWVLMRDWVPDVAAGEKPPAAAARAELADRWLRAFGPATYDDLRWWTGWTATRTRTAVCDSGAVEVDLEDGESALVAAGDAEPDPPVGPWVALLPSLDPTTMGWRRRGFYLGSYADLLFDRYGNAGPTIWSEGRVVGGWGQRPDGSVVVRLLEDVGADASARVDAEAAWLTEWLDGVRVRPSFPTPLQRELSG